MTKSIQQFYAGSTILVTGGTGCLGKGLIEKLLRTCKDIKCVYILLRSKRGQRSEDRLEMLKNNQVWEFKSCNEQIIYIFTSQIFDRLRVEYPQSLDKLTALNGDMTENKLGLSIADMELFKSSIDYVFHSAASISFIESTKYAIDMNVLGTRRILDLCREATQLKVLKK